MISEIKGRKVKFGKHILVLLDLSIGNLSSKSNAKDMYLERSYLF